MTDTSWTKEVEALFSLGRLNALRAQGLDVLEGRRAGAYLYAPDGTRYLDCLGGAGTFNLGRRHEELADELKRALAETDQGNFPMISIEKARLAQALAEFVPGDLDCAVFGVVRGEALDCACKVARGFTRRSELLSVDGGCYGQTGFALSLSARSDKDRFGPLIPATSLIAHNDLEAARRAIGRKTAAVILEPVQAENRCRKAENGYLRELRTLCDEAGALLILDETQSGFGRTGAKFAYEDSGITPDLLILGEALGAGLFPITVTLLTQRVNSFLNAHPMIHLSTFGGSDLGCRVATKALAIYQREAPWTNARIRGAELLDGLRSLAARHPEKLTSVQGAGLLLSLEFAGAERAREFGRLLAGQGVLAQVGEVAADTLVLRPSLLIDTTDVQALIKAVGAALNELP